MKNNYIYSEKDYWASESENDICLSELYWLYSQKERIKIDEIIEVLLLHLDNTNRTRLVAIKNQIKQTLNP